jgi:hypothetical protein
MRTSNKILLSVFVGGLVIITAVQATLFAKYESGDFTIIKPEESSFVSHGLKGINCISLTGFSGVNIRSSKDPHVETEKDTSGHLQVSIKNDTLVIVDTSLDLSEPNSIDRNYSTVNIYLANATMIHASRCEISVPGTNSAEDAIPYTLTITDKTALKLAIEDGAQPSRRFVKGLQVKAATGSQVQIGGSVITDLIDASLTTDAELEEYGASIGTLKIAADSSCYIKLTGANLKKINRP